MKSSTKLLKLALVLMVLVTSSLRPVVVYAHNSHNNSLLAKNKNHHVSSAKCSISKPVQLAKTLKVLDKEKNEAVCLTPKVQKEISFLACLVEPKTTGHPLDVVPPQLQVLRI